MKPLVLVSTLCLFMASCVTETIEKLQPFQLNDVRLIDSPFKNAEDIDKEYLIELDADRLLAPYQKEAGITPVKENYTNWENTGLDGHIGGHYISACAMMYASTGDTAMLNRVNYMIEKLGECQEKAGNGYLCGVPGGREMWNEIAKGHIDAATFSLNHKWVPLYNIHKIFAGLRDAYIFTGNKKALDELIQLSDWFLSITEHLSDEQLQQMLISEHGGMNEVFVDVYSLSGNQKYLTFAKRFSDNSILNPLITKNINLPGMHANTQIPKVIGFKRYADEAQDTAWNNASKYFWDIVVNQMSVSIGGNSVREHFHSPNDFSSMIESEQGPETCNTYNMLKLTKQFYFSDNNPDYINFYERALYNHILSSQHNHHTGFVYFTPMRPQHYRVYSTVQNCFWCCVGSGLENHSKYGEMIYAHDNNDVYVNLFIPSTLNWSEKGLNLTMETKFPYSETINIKVNQSKDPIKLNIRIPEWTNEKDITVTKNNEIIKHNIVNGYIRIKGHLKSEDRISIQLPMHISIEYLPDHSNYASIKYGPVVLAAKTSTKDLDGLFADDSRMGHVAQGKMYPLDKAPHIITDYKDFTDIITPVDKTQLKFTFNVEGLDSLILQPFYEVHEARYMLYWPVYTQQEFDEKMEAIAKAEKAKLALEAQTIDQIGPGEQQPESDHFFNGEHTNNGIHKNNFWRDASGWFSYILKDKKNEAKELQIMYYGLDGGGTPRQFDILLNNQILTTVTLKGDKGDAFFTVNYKIPASISEQTKNGKMPLKFVAHENSVAGGIYYIRLLR